MTETEIIKLADKFGPILSKIIPTDSETPKSLILLTIGIIEAWKENRSIEAILFVVQGIYNNKTVLELHQNPEFRNEYMKSIALKNIESNELKDN